MWGTRAFLHSYNGAEFVVYGLWSNAVVDGRGVWSPCRTAYSLGLDTSKHGIVTAARLPEIEVFQSAPP